MRDYEIINDNLRCALAAFSYARPTGMTHAGAGVSLVSAGVQHSLFNTALLMEHLPSECGGFADVLYRARDFFAEKNLPWSIWFCDSLLTPAERRASRIVLASAGLKLMMDTPGMIAEKIAPLRRSGSDLSFRRVEDTETRGAFTQIMSRAFQVPVETADDVYGGELLWSGPLTGWIGYVGKLAVTTACTVVGGDSIGLYAVGTVPEAQRKGYGEAVVRHAVNAAREASGLTRTILQSSASGYALYTSMGFRNVTRFNVYVK